MYFNDMLKEYMDAVHQNEEKKIVIKRAGLNASGNERILLYATAGIRLFDYIVCVEQRQLNRNYCFRFPNEDVLTRDTYICLFTGSVNGRARMRGTPIPTYCMHNQSNILQVNDIIRVCEFDTVSKMRVTEG